MLQDCGCAAIINIEVAAATTARSTYLVPRIHLRARLLRKRSRVGGATGHADITDNQIKSARTKSTKDTKVLGYTANNENFVSERWIAEGSDLAG
jgi:hypothetical protein